MAKISLKTQAYNVIKKNIISTKYAPGSYLNEELLTEELKISRTPVHDALCRLEQEALLEIKPKHGIIVAPITLSDINMIFELRLLYEPYIVKEYASSLPLKKLQKYEQIFRSASEKSVSELDVAYYHDLDCSFHQMIVDTCPNKFIRQQYELVQTHNTRLRSMTGDNSDARMMDTLREHLAIITPALKSDWNEAAVQMRHHLEETKAAAFQMIISTASTNHIEI